MNEQLGEIKVMQTIEFSLPIILLRSPDRLHQLSRGCGAVGLMLVRFDIIDRR